MAATLQSARRSFNRNSAKVARVYRVAKVGYIDPTVRVTKKALLTTAVAVQKNAIPLAKVGAEAAAILSIWSVKTGIRLARAAMKTDAAVAARQRLLLLHDTTIRRLRAATDSGLALVRDAAQEVLATIVECVYGTDIRRVGTRLLELELKVKQLEAERSLRTIAGLPTSAAPAPLKAAGKLPAEPSPTPLQLQNAATPTSQLLVQSDASSSAKTTERWGTSSDSSADTICAIDHEDLAAAARSLERDALPAAAAATSPASPAPAAAPAAAPRTQRASRKRPQLPFRSAELRGKKLRRTEPAPAAGPAAAAAADEDRPVRRSSRISATALKRAKSSLSAAGPAQEAEAPPRPAARPRGRRGLTASALRTARGRLSKPAALPTAEEVQAALSGARDVLRRNAPSVDTSALSTAVLRDARSRLNKAPAPRARPPLPPPRKDSGLLGALQQDDTTFDFFKRALRSKFRAAQSSPAAPPTPQTPWI